MPWLLLLASMACADTARDPSINAKMQLLAEDAQEGKRWVWGWGSSLVVGVAAQFTLAVVVDDEDFRIDRLVGGGTAGIGLLTVIFTHPSAMRASRQLGPCPTDEEVNVAFERVAAEERFNRAWFQHVLGTGANVGAGLYLALAHDHWASGAMQALVGSALAEAMILTRPHQSADFTIVPMVSRTDGEYGLSVSLRL